MHLSYAHRASVVAGNSTHPKRHVGFQTAPLPSVHGSLREYVTQLQARAYGDCADLLHQNGIASVREPLQDHEKMPRTREEHEFELRHGRDVPRCGTMVVPMHAHNTTTHHHTASGGGGEDKVKGDVRVAHLLIVQELQRTCVSVDMRWDAGQSKSQEMAMWRELGSQVEYLMACHNACRRGSNARGGDDNNNNNNKSASLDLALQWHLSANIIASASGTQNVNMSREQRDRSKSPHQVLFEQQVAYQRLRGATAGRSFVEECRRTYPSMSVTHMRRLHHAQMAHGGDVGVRMTLKCAVVRFVKISHIAHQHLVEAIALEGGYVAADDNPFDRAERTLGTPLSLAMEESSDEEGDGQLYSSDSDSWGSSSNAEDEGGESDEGDESEWEDDEDEENDGDEVEEEQEEEEEGEQPLVVATDNDRVEDMIESEEEPQSPGQIQRDLQAERRTRLTKMAERSEQARIAGEKEEQARIAADKEKEARIAAEKEEEARIAAEKKEEARIAAEKEERARLAKVAEDAKLAKKARQLRLAEKQARLAAAAVDTEVEEIEEVPSSEEEEKEEEDEIVDDFSDDESMPPELVDNLSDDTDVATGGGESLSAAPGEEEPQQQAARAVQPMALDDWNRSFSHSVNAVSYSYKEQMTMSPPAIINAAKAGRTLYSLDLDHEVQKRLDATEDRSTNLFAIVYDSVHPTDKVTMKLAEFAGEMDDFARGVPVHLANLYEESMDFIIRSKDGGLGYGTSHVAQACPVTFDVVFTTFLTSYIVMPLITLFYKQLKEASKGYDRLSAVQLANFANTTAKLNDPTDENMKHLRTQVLEFKNVIGKETVRLTNTLAAACQIDRRTLEEEVELFFGKDEGGDNQRRQQFPRKYSEVSDWDVLQHFSVLNDLLKVTTTESETSPAPKSTMPEIVQTRTQSLTPLVASKSESDWKVTQAGVSGKKPRITNGDVLDNLTKSILRVTRAHVLNGVRGRLATSNYAWIRRLGTNTNRAIDVGNLSNAKSMIAGHGKLMVANKEAGKNPTDGVKYLEEKNTVAYRLCYLQRVLSIVDVLLHPSRLVRLINERFGVKQMNAILGGDETTPQLSKINTPEKHLRVQTLLLARIYMIQIMRAQYSVHKVLSNLSNALRNSNQEYWRVLTADDSFVTDAKKVQEAAIVQFDSVVESAHAPTGKALETALGWTQGVLCHMEANMSVEDDELFDAAQYELALYQDTKDLMVQLTGMSQLVPKLDASELVVVPVVVVDSVAQSSTSSSSQLSEA